ncbi:concanavalin A-like lectin/glucanase [Aureobasidium pullulans]|uniref:Concanavalin A-like lectin/glucanase n=1 Tax=Aureobasidium pullulans TaxID=5580 RepID=A0AB74J7B1_AURPU|nr:concanavalin A-like lectin/glucanase [Aureobasidium pullulans]
MVLSRVIRDVLLMSASSSAFVSNNWAGGAHTDNGRITKASADLVVPECKVGTPAYKTVDYSLSGWVGIDGLTCNDVVLQAGFSCYATEMENGTTTATYSAWTEWFPSPQQQLPDFAIHAGDPINIQIVADSKISGYTLLHNRRTGQKTHTPYTNQTTPLCLDNAEWVIESHLIFAKFGLDGQRTAGYSPFKFEHASWTTKGGKKHLASKADMFNMVQNGTEVAEATYKKAGSFVVNDVTPADFASTDY